MAHTSPAKKKIGGASFTAAELARLRPMVDGLFDKCGKNQSEMGRRLGIGQSGARKMLQTGGMSRATATRLCEAMGTTLEEQLGIQIRGEAADPELQAVLDAPSAAWHDAVVAAARVLAAKGTRRTQREWAAILDELTARMAPWL